MDQHTEKLLKDFLEEREILDVKGNALLINHKGEEIFRHYTGTSKKETLYRIFSMSKVVTVVAALQLLEKGKYTLDDPLSLYMPEFKEMTVWDEEKKEAVPCKNEILIRHLFTMSAGISYPGDDCETARRTKEFNQHLEETHPGSSYTTQEYMRGLSKIPLVFEPGTHWRYSLCHDVLGALIEIWSGETFGEYVKNHIFTPLHMENTFFTCPEDKWENIADCEEDEMRDMKYKASCKYESGGGGLLSTLDDYMTFARTLTCGGTSESGVRILGRKTIDLMRLDNLNDTQKIDFNWSYIKGYSYGLGVRTMIDLKEAGIPGSKYEFGWCGVMGTWVLMDPEEDLTVVYMHQRFPNLEEYVQKHLRQMIYGLIL